MSNRRGIALRARASTAATRAGWLVLALIFVLASSLDASAARKKRKKRRGRKAKQAKVLSVGDQAPPFSGDRALGGTVDSTTWVGETASGSTRALVVAFVDLGDSDAMRTVNEARKLDSEWGAKDVVVVVIGTGNDLEAVESFVLNNAVGWDFVPDSGSRVSRAFGAASAPRLVVVDGAGVVRALVDGTVDGHTKVRTVLADLLGVEMPWGPSGRRSTLLSHDAKYRFGRPPSDRGASTRWQPLAMFMGDVANVFISMTTTRTYDDFERQLQKGEFEIANAGAALGYRILDLYEPVVNFQRRDKATYRGIIFARKDSGVSSVEDLRGKTIALVSPRSTSGGAYPAAELIKAGLTLEDDVRLLWVKTHRAVAEAVRDGRAVAGACYDDCREGIWPTSAAREKETLIVGLTDDIPTEMIFFRRDLPQRKKDRLRTALLSVGGRDLVVKHMSRAETPITGVVPADVAVLERVKATLTGIPEALAEARVRAAQRASE